MLFSENSQIREIYQNSGAGNTSVGLHLAYTGNTDNTDNTDNWDVSQGEQEEQAKGGIKKRAADVLKERQVRRTAIKTIPPCYMLPRFRWASRR